MTVGRHFDELADSWMDRYVDRPSFRHRLQLVEAELAPLLRPDTLLVDFGSGAGVFSALVSGRVAAVLSVDASEDMLRAAQRGQRVLDEVVRQVGAVHAPERITRVVGKRASLSGAGSADVVLAIAVLEYVHDLAEHVQSLASMLRPGGHLLLTYPYEQSWGRRVERPLDAIATAAGRVLRRDRLAQREYSTLRPARHPDLGALLVAHGLDVVGRRPLALGMQGWRARVAPNLLWVAQAPGQPGLGQVSGGSSSAKAQW